MIENYLQEINKPIYSYPENVERLWSEYEKKAQEMLFMRDVLKEKFIKMVKEKYGLDNLPHIFLRTMKEKSKENINILKHHLNKDFGKQNWDFTNMRYLGYEPYGFCIEFTLNRKRYKIEIPYYENLNVSNMQYTVFGRYCLLERENQHSLKMIMTDFSKEKIAEFIKILADKKV